MLSLVAMGINLITQSIQNVFFFTSLIGRIIVEAGARVLMFFAEIFSSILLFIKIVYEDNITIFSEDLPNLMCSIFNCISNQIHSLNDGVTSVNNNILSQVNNSIESFKWLIYSSFIIFCEVFRLTKNVFILFGETIWFIIIFIPVHLPVLLKEIINNIVTIVVETVISGYSSLLKFTNFLSDVPLESFLGMMSVILLLRLCCYFRDEIQNQIIYLYWLLIRRLNFLYYSVYNYVTDSEVRVITNMSGNDEIETRSIEDIGANDIVDETDTLCVICQERQKCVLTLPCRHICLCSECCKRLYNYQRTCPICRTFIYHSVTVYL